MALESGLQIRVLEGADAGAVTPLDMSKMTIGRARVAGSRVDGWVLLFDKSVSREHAELAWNHQEAHYVLRHISKTNFTWVDDVPLETETVIELGQVVQMGGTRLVVEELQEVEATPETTPQQSTSKAGSNTVAEKLKDPVRAVALRENGPPRLAVLQGVDAGFTDSLSGLYVTIGRGNLSAAKLFEDEKAQPFDQVVELTASQVHPNHLILKWDELRKGYSIFNNLSVPSPLIRRHADGLNWQAPLTNAGGVVRVGDRVFFAETEIQIEESGSDPKSPISPVSLSPPGS